MSGTDRYVYDRPRDERTWSWASRCSIDERLEQKVRFTKHVGPVFTAFGDHDYIFYHDGQKLRCYTDSDLNPGWIYVGDEARSCLRHQLRMDRDYRTVTAANHRLVSPSDERNNRGLQTGTDQSENAGNRTEER